MAARQVEGLTIERPAGELLVLKPSSKEGHAFNETAATSSTFVTVRAPGPTWSPKSRRAPGVES
jgi:hypothetical protein